jgi:thioredoxin-like negative regulator of GroEL
MSQQSFTAILLTTPGCVHCAALKKILDKFLSEGLLTQLEVIDIANHPEVAGTYGVKSVPWLKLGPFEFSGAQREPELRSWIKKLHTPQGIAAYIKHLLATDDLDLAISLIRNNPAMIEDVITLVTEEDKDIKLQLGISAIFEEFEGSALLQTVVDQLGELAAHDNPKVRADVAHFLALSHTEKAKVFLRQLAQDSDREVREVASDALQDGTH